MPLDVIVESKFKLGCWVFVQIRDITSNPEWEKAYQYEIPVLAKVLSDGTEVSLCCFELSPFYTHCPF